MPDLSELNLSEESTPQVDWDAPEAGTAPPQVTPGTYTWLFKMPEARSDWFDAMEVVMGKDPQGGDIKKRFLKINFEAQCVGDKDGNPYTPAEGQELPTLRYQNASMFKSDKMAISNGGEMLRALGIRITGPLTPEAIAAELEKVNGRVTFKADVIWRAYFKSTETTVSTSPRKKTKRGPEHAWPKQADGTFDLQVVNPKNPNDLKQYGRAEISRFHSPQAAAA